MAPAPGVHEAGRVGVPLICQDLFRDLEPCHHLLPHLLACHDLVLVAFLLGDGPSPAHRHLVHLNMHRNATTN